MWLPSRPNADRTSTRTTPPTLAPARTTPAAAAVALVLGALFLTAACSRDDKPKPGAAPGTLAAEESPTRPSESAAESAIAAAQSGSGSGLDPGATDSAATEGAARAISAGAAATASGIDSGVPAPDAPGTHDRAVVASATKWAATRMVRVEVEVVPAGVGVDIATVHKVGTGFLVKSGEVTTPLSLAEPARFDDGWPDAYPHGVRTQFRVSVWSARKGALLALFTTAKANVQHTPLAADAEASPTALTTLHVGASPRPLTVSGATPDMGAQLVAVGFRQLAGVDEPSGLRPFGVPGTMAGEAEDGTALILQLTDPTSPPPSSLLGAPVVVTVDNKHAVIGAVVSIEPSFLLVRRLRP